MRTTLLLAVMFWRVSLCAAHDAWIQPNTNLVRTGDVVHLDLLLGNHGNAHRDFKQAGKVDLDGASFELLMPGGERLDLRERLMNTGYAPQDGHWTCRLQTDKPGYYVVGHQSDKVMSYGPVRSVKSAKALFLASNSLDKSQSTVVGFEREMGHTLEFVPLSSPAAPAGPGIPLKVRLQYRGSPLPGATVSYIPRGETLAEGFDSRYERITNDQGEASFTPSWGTYYLIVAHHEELDESGPGYEKTKYSATLCVYVPQVCACCSE